MNKKLICLVLSVVMILSSLSTLSAQAVPIAPTLKIGDYIQMGKYLDKPIIWRCVDIDENGPLMLADKPICRKAFDASGVHKYLDGTKQPDNGNEDRLYTGSNLWQTSSLRSWLNSTATAGKVVWLDGCPPDDDHVDGEFPYANEKGFLADGNFTSSDLSLLKSVSQKTLLNELDAAKLKTGGTGVHILDMNGVETIMTNYDVIFPEWEDYGTAYYHMATDRMFLLGIKQIYKVFQNEGILGAEYHVSSVASVWESDWLRDPGAYLEDLYYLRIVDGMEMKAYNTSNVRPAFYINMPTTVFKSGNGTVGNPYVVTGNAPVLTTAPTFTQIIKPAIPTKFNVVCKGQAMTLTWDKTATADYYYIYYKKANGAFIKEKVTTNTKVYSKLAKSTKYTYKVTAVNSAGEGKTTVELWKVTSK